MDQWAWTRQEAVQYLGITMAIGGLIGAASFASIGPLARRYDERKLLVFCGLIPLIIGKLIYFPVGEKFPQMYRNITKESKLTTIVLPFRKYVVVVAKQVLASLNPFL